MRPNPDHEKQGAFFVNLLQRKRGLLTPDDQVFGAVKDWLALPLQISNQTRVDVHKALQQVMQKSAAEITQIFRLELEVDSLPQTNGHVPSKPVSLRTVLQDKIVRARVQEAELLSLLPETGYFRKYAEYTSCNEAPLSYHFWCALAGLAATVNRRVFLDMGNHKLFPPFGVFLLGDSGIKKTTSGDTIVSILRELSTVPVYAEKLTPEALIDGMKENATGLVYAPEMTVLISKQKYMESIIPLLTRFMDSPDIWDSGTIMRGKVKLVDVAITCLMCSTIDWFTKNTPEAVFGGGFIARNIMVLQDVSPRIVPLPPPENTQLRRSIVIDLANLASMKGQATLSQGAKEEFNHWYVENKMSRMAENDLFETYFARKHAHLLRTAMCLHLGTHVDLEVCNECLHRALAILEWTERGFAHLNDKMFKSPYGLDQDLVLRAIVRAGGKITHAELVRKVSYKLSGGAARACINGLKEQGIIREFMNTMTHYYELVRED